MQRSRSLRGEPVASRLLASLAFVGLAYGATGPSMVLNAWNPNVAYPLFLLFVLLAWVFTTGHPRALVGIALVGSVLVQAHIGYLPLVAAASRPRSRSASRTRAPPGRAWRGPVQWSVLGLVLLWLPPVINEFVHPSNLHTLARSLTESGEPSLGTRSAGRILAEEFELPPPWLGGHHRLEGFGNTVVGASPWWLMVPALLLLGAVLAICVRRRRGIGRVAGLDGDAHRRRLRRAGARHRRCRALRLLLARTLALLVVFTFVWCVWLALDLDRFDARAATRGRRARGDRARRIGHAHDPDRGYPQREPGGTHHRDALAAVDGRVGATSRILVRDADIPLIGIERGDRQRVDRDGVPVKVDEGLGYQFGYSRTARPETVDEVWYVVELGQSLSLLADLPGAMVLWNTSPLSAAEEAELQAGQRELYPRCRTPGARPLLPLAVPVGRLRAARHRRRRSRNAATGRRPEFEGGGVGRLPLAIVAFDPADAAAAAAVLPRPS